MADERLRKLLETNHEEAEHLLVENGIYEILGYGWSDADIPDPEYIGLAMWQTDPPFEPDWQAVLNGRPAAYAPTEKDEVLLSSGEDFVGTMEFARRSLGMALCYGAATNSLDDIETQFWQEYASTAQWLNIASDRLLDYFLMARFGQKRKDYQKNNPRARYVAPFKEALELASDNEQRKLLSRVVTLVEALQSHRKERNDIVHQVATKRAEVSVKMLREQREHATSGRTFAVSPEDNTVVSATRRVKSWYIHLVKISSLVFEFEYWSRKQRNS